MREFAGWVIVHATLIIVGLAALRALGLVGCGPRCGIAALGPALLLGVCLVVLSLVVLLVCGLPATLWTAALLSAAWSAAGVLIGIRRGRSDMIVPASGTDTEAEARSPRNPIRRLTIALLTAYAAFGAYALARAPTVSDDARIWSLKGLTLAYYDTLRPEIFDSPFVTRAHPVYPLFQPVFEAVLFRGMGHPALRWFHAELWLLCGAALWTAAYLLDRARLRSRGWFGWAPALALIAVAPQVLLNLGMGYADTSGSIILASGVVALGCGSSVVAAVISVSPRCCWPQPPTSKTRTSSPRAWWSSSPRSRCSSGNRAGAGRSSSPRSFSLPRLSCRGGSGSPPTT